MWWVLNTDQLEPAIHPYAIQPSVCHMHLDIHSLYLSGRVWPMHARVCGTKPMLSILSASSSTTYVTFRKVISSACMVIVSQCAYCPHKATQKQCSHSHDEATCTHARTTFDGGLRITSKMSIKRPGVATATSTPCISAYGRVGGCRRVAGDGRGQQRRVAYRR